MQRASGNPARLPEKGEDLISNLGHGLCVLGLYIESKQGLGIRWSNVKPPLAAIDCDAIEIIDS